MKTPEELIAVFEESNNRMKNYLHRIKYRVVERDATFQLGDLICYPSDMWGLVPGRIIYLRDKEVACELIDIPDTCSAWQKISEIKHIEIIDTCHN